MEVKNKENGLKRKIKIGISLVIIGLLLISSVGISTLTITDEGLEFDNGRWFAGESDYVVWRDGTEYYAKNMDNGTIYTNGANDLDVLLNKIILEEYTHNLADYSIYGSKISLKSGRYNLYNQVDLMPGTCIEGNGGMKDAGDPATTIADYASDPYLFYYDGSILSGCSITIKNIAIKNYGAGVGKTIIYMNRTCGSLIEGVTIMQGIAGTYKHGIYLGSHSHANHIVNCDIYNAGGAGIYLETTHSPFLCCNANVIRDTRSRANLDGIYIDEGCVGNTIEGCAIEANTRYGINLSDDNDGYDYGADKTTIHATHFEEDIAIHIYGGYGTTIDSCYFYHSDTGVIVDVNRNNLPEGTTISNVYIPLSTTTYLNFSGNNTLIEGNFVPGIKIEEGNHTTIIGNTLTNATLGLVLNGTNTPNTKIYSNNLNGGSITNYQNDTTMFDNVGFYREQLSGLDYIYSNGTEQLGFLPEGINILNSMYVNNFETFIGYASGDNVISGSGTGIFSTAVGHNTLTALTSGNGNTAVGFRVLDACRNGVDNTGIGNSALSVLTSGSDNVGCGASSLFFLTTGLRNTAVGSYAGQSATNSLNNCIYIGFSAGRYNKNQSNLFIDSSSDTTPLIHGNFTTDTLTINDILVIAPRSTIPTSPVEGMIYYNSTVHLAYCYNGTAWNALW